MIDEPTETTKSRIRLNTEKFIVKILAIDKDQRQELKKRLTEKFPDYEVGETHDTQFWTGSDYRAFYTVTVDVPCRETARDIGRFVANQFGPQVNLEDGRK